MLNVSSAKAFIRFVSFQSKVFISSLTWSSKDSGRTVIVVEHIQQVIHAADWIVDLGPEGGDNGGQVVFTGTPLEMLQHGDTITADWLRKS